MPSWTQEQLLAINKSGTNIIVSAGAGSGKTAVLTERVITKLKQKINVNELLVLTFTNEASNEMKQRIRSAIEKEPNLKEQLNYLDSAYITTFDSFALSILKKYHYVLNISKEIINIDQTIINIKTNELLNEIFEERYKDNENFHNLINTFCFKDDEMIKKSIIELSNKLDLKIDKNKYLNNYISTFYNENYLNNLVEQYEQLIIKKVTEIKYLTEDLLIYADGTYYEKVMTSLINLLDKKNYEDIYKNIDITLPRMYKDAPDEVKNIKEEINKILKELKEQCTYKDKNEIKDSILLTKDNIKEIIELIKELDKRINEYKYQHNAFTFNDIAKLSIKILIENDEIKEELKNSFKEIMIDEYQDTSDLQEIFISLIQNNNTYMVGDIKQSIYRFRNANPNIFKTKYINYSNNIEGFKIDLLKNFRSRDEVLNNINEIFNLIMDEDIGGADYIRTHQMVFGNNSYINEGKTIHDNNIEILNYSYETKDYSKEEIEIFTIAKDIKDKINNKYQVYDRNINNLRDITFNDFCIIMDRGSEFEKYKKIFEYLEIPSSIYQDEKLTTEYDVLILKNILGLILKINKKEFDVDFRYYFTSVARSFLFNFDDNEIFKMFKEHNFYHNKIFELSKNISNDLINLNNKDLIIKIINDFNFYEKTITIGSISPSIIRLNNLINIASSLQTLEYTIEEMFKYLEEMINCDQDIKYQVKEPSSNSVKIMNIHKSKGLEFPICYFSGLHKEFNKQDINKNILYDEEYGILIPYYKDNLQETIIKDLVIDKYNKEEISEKIRLLYVALTRVKEKIIIVTNLKEQDNKLLTNTVNNNKRLKYKSFLDIFNSIRPNLEKYIKEIDIKNLNINKDYNNIKQFNYKNYLNETNNKIKVINLPIDNLLEKEQRFSKNIHNLITEKEYKDMKYGIEVHKLLEQTTNNEIYEKLQEKINFNNCNIYKEYEFIYEENNIEYHGIIDLLLEYEDNIKIIDYKLKNIIDDNYIKQLQGYKKYIKNKTNKNIEIYLYSILDNEIKEILC